MDAWKFVYYNIEPLTGRIDFAVIRGTEARPYHATKGRYAGRGLDETQTRPRRGPDEAQTTVQGLCRACRGRLDSVCVGRLDSVWIELV